MYKMILVLILTTLFSSFNASAVSFGASGGDGGDEPIVGISTREKLLPIIDAFIQRNERNLAWAESFGENQKIRMADMISRMEKNEEDALKLVDFFDPSRTQRTIESAEGQKIEVHLRNLIAAANTRINREIFHNQKNYANYDKSGAVEEFEISVGQMKSIRQILLSNSNQLQDRVNAAQRLEALQKERIQEENRLAELNEQLAKMGQVSRDLETLKLEKNNLTKDIAAKKEEFRTLVKEGQEASDRRDKMVKFIDDLAKKYQTGKYSVSNQVKNIQKVPPKLQAMIASYITAFVEAKLNELLKLNREEWEKTPLQIEMETSLIGDLNIKKAAWYKFWVKPEFTFAVNVTATTSIPWATKTAGVELHFQIKNGQMTFVDQDGDNDGSDVFLMNFMDTLAKNADSLQAETKFRSLPTMLEDLLKAGVGADKIETAMVRVHTPPAPCADAVTNPDEDFATDAIAKNLDRELAKK